MGSQSHPRKPSASSRYGGQQPLPNMATPRRPEPPKKMGFFGFLFILLILAVVVWLVMLIFGWGPYQRAAGEEDPTLTATVQTSPLPIIATGTLAPGLTSTTAVTPIPTVTLTPTQELMPFVLFGEPEILSSALIRPQLGCEWLVIAGQVWDLQDESVPGLKLHLYGELAGYEIERVMISGSALAYGESGYEFAFENLLVDSDGTLYIQLEDADGQPLSHPYPLETFANCQQNLLLVNFKQVR